MRGAAAGGTLRQAPPVDRCGMTTTIRWRVSRRTRRALLITHLVSGLGLMGYLLATTLVRLQADADPAIAGSALYDWYRRALTPMMGGSMSLLALTTGILLGLTTRWGVLRYGWVTAKLGLLLAVLTSVALLPAVWLTSTAQWGALLTATVLSVVKPGSARRSVSPTGVATRPGGLRPPSVDG
jgi:hypothetical protein